MAVKIRLKRMGKIRAPFYRVVVMDSRTKRDGRAIEEIGKYHPTNEPSVIDINSERAQYWLGVGAQPTEQVLALLKVTGDWQKFKGLPGAEGTLRTAPPKADKKALYEAALAAAMGSEEQAKDPAPRRRGGKGAQSEAAAESAPADSASADSTPADSAPAEATSAEPAPAASTDAAASEQATQDSAPTAAEASDKPAEEADASATKDAPAADAGTDTPTAEA